MYTPTTVTQLANQMCGRQFRHYKGGVYEVCDIAKLSEDREQLVVVYWSVSKGGTWVRPFTHPTDDAWEDIVTWPDEINRKRFVPVEEVGEMAWDTLLDIYCSSCSDPNSKENPVQNRKDNNYWCERCWEISKDLEATKKATGESYSDLIQTERESVMKCLRGISREVPHDSPAYRLAQQELAFLRMSEDFEVSEKKSDTWPEWTPKGAKTGFAGQDSRFAPTNFDLSSVELNDKQIKSEFRDPSEPTLDELLCEVIAASYGLLWYQREIRMLFRVPGLQSHADTRWLNAIGAFIEATWSWETICEFLSSVYQVKSDGLQAGTSGIKSESETKVKSKSKKKSASKKKTKSRPLAGKRKTRKK